MRLLPNPIVKVLLLRPHSLSEPAPPAKIDKHLISLTFHFDTLPRSRSPTRKQLLTQRSLASHMQLGRQKGNNMHARDFGKVGGLAGHPFFRSPSHLAYG